MTQRSLTRADLFVCCACFAGAFFGSLAPVALPQGGDTVPGRLGAAALACEGTFHLGRIEWIDARARRGKIPYFINISADQRQLVSSFGPAPAVLGWPAFVSLEPATAVTDDDLIRRARYASGVWVALAGVLGYVALRASLSRALAALGAAVMLLAYSGAATLAQGLWQQTAALLPVMAAVAALAWGERRSAWLTVVPAALAAAAWIRPADLPTLAGLGAAWVVVARRTPFSLSRLVGASALAAIVVAPFALYHLVYTDSFLPMGQLRTNVEQAPGGAVFGGSPARVGPALLGLLVSPARGLVLFAPVALVGIGLGFARDRAARFIAAGLVGQILLAASFFKWWGGLCFGPRLLSLGVWVAIWLAFREVGTATGRRRRLVLLTGAWTIVVGALGLVAYDPRKWEIRRDPDRQPASLWDVADSPLTALFRPIPDLPLRDAPAGPFVYCDRAVLTDQSRSPAEP